ncbi:MAG: CPBP family intramembrane metalloprotease [Planctomycetes bacterium]|nr:CPBP family intramembrane metalloprotease [Planctomycetota bacterium]
MTLFSGGGLWRPKSLKLVGTAAYESVSSGVAAVLERIGVASVGMEVRHGAYLLLFLVVVPWAVMAMVGRGRPADLGTRRPNRVGWRLLIIGFCLSLPFLYWMVQSPRFAPYYGPQLERIGTGAFLAYYLVNMLSEHFFLHGFVLAACRVGHRWPEPAGLVENVTRGVRRTLQWLGLAQPVDDATGWRRVRLWIGLPPGCLPALITSTALFAAVHVGKDGRELLLSIPGGVALAYVAYRSESWLIPFVLHLATAGTACVMMVSGI